jgi:hypothetical protein
LALNRCLAFTHYYWIFDEWRQWIWFTLPLAYASLIFAFAQAPIYNSIYGAWFFNPHLGYFGDEENTVSFCGVNDVGNWMDFLIERNANRIFPIENYSTVGPRYSAIEGAEKIRIKRGQF